MDSNKVIAALEKIAAGSQEMTSKVASTFNAVTAECSRLAKDLEEKNAVFQKQLKKHLRFLREDIESNRFEILKLQAE